MTEIQEPAGPSEHYLNRQTGKQTHNSPAALKTAQGVIPLPSHQSSQDVRFIEARSKEVVFHINGTKTGDTNTGERPLMVVLKSGRKTGRDSEIV